KVVAQEPSFPAPASPSFPIYAADGQATMGPGETREPLEAERQRGWLRVEYLLWWLKPVCLKPPTLTVGSPADAVPGAVGQPGTQVIQGDHKFEFGGASGFNIDVGAWLTSDQVVSFEAGGFLLAKAEARQSYRSG